MRVTALRLENFRNHERTELRGADSVNVLLGDNGEGKTNILEAVSYLCLTKSFYAANDRVTAQIGKEYFVLEGKLLSDRGLDVTVRVTYDAINAQKRFLVNNAEVETLASVVGRFPVVILSPEGGTVTTGSPSDRRKFVDLALSQASKRYLDELLEYRRVLKQRNKVLLDARIARQDPGDALEPWSKSLVEHGTQLILKRREFIKVFAAQVADAFQQLTGELETPSLKYAPSVAVEESDSSGDIAEKFSKELETQFPEEQRAGTSLVGPHRDEIEFTINGLDLRKFASQGQHKTFLVALKVAEFHYLKEQCNETPMLLLDDVFSELDEHRSHRLLNMVGELGQTFITSTSEQVFAGALELNGGARKFFVKQGIVA